MGTRKIDAKQIVRSRQVAAAVYQFPTAFVAIAHWWLTGLIAWVFASYWTYQFRKQEGVAEASRGEGKDSDAPLGN